jgi:NAD(P)-dependent dehydrogenase (short-subunit alcohol dehydrogenase family)
LPFLLHPETLLKVSYSGTNGLGKETILALAKHSPEHIFFTGRDGSSAKSIISDVKSTASSVKLTYIECDQLSLDSVKNAAKEFLSASSQLDVLICNAGVMATEPALTKEGYENQFGVNHVAHALFVKLLMPTLQKTAEKTGDVRILFLTSLGFMYPFPGGIAFDGVKTTQDFGPGSQWARYGQSKLANVLYPSELARRYPSITSVSLHPGAVNTDLIGRLKPDEKELVYQANKVILEPHEGVYTTCWCATTKHSGLKNGELYLPVGQLGEHSKESSDKELAERLWTWTEKELERYNL